MSTENIREIPTESISTGQELGFELNIPRFTSLQRQVLENQGAAIVALKGRTRKEILGDGVIKILTSDPWDLGHIDNRPSMQTEVGLLINERISLSGTNKEFHEQLSSATDLKSNEIYVETDKVGESHNLEIAVPELNDVLEIINESRKSGVELLEEDELWYVGEGDDLGIKRRYFVVKDDEEFVITSRTPSESVSAFVFLLAEPS